MKNKNPFAVHRVSRKRSKKPTYWKAILKYVGISLFTLLLTLAVYKSQQAAEWFKASVLEPPQPFNGTVMPVEKVPDWSHGPFDVKTTYSMVPENKLIPLPPYDLSLIGFPDEKLVWGNASQDAIRNAKITYSVVYLGSYEKNHTEGSGSHLAVDIKMPEGTPVHAIANGQVVKAVTTENGFGHHIVVKHLNVPDPEHPGSLTTLYSTYNHLSDVLVAEGQNVMKGELIGRSGNTGTSTTPHLHLQIDKDSAPWHPYWPFTWAESQSAGLSFFEAVNAGLGLDKARENTIDPLPFIALHLNDSLVTSNSLAALPPPPTPAPEPSTAPAVASTIVLAQEPPVDVASTESAVDPSLMDFELTGENVSLINNGVRILVKDNSNQVEKLGDSDSVRVTIQGVGRALTPQLRKADFKDGVAAVIVKSAEAGSSQVVIGKNSRTITFLESVANTFALKFEPQGTLTKNELGEVNLYGIDQNGAKTPALNFSGEVELSVKDGQATVIPNRLSVDDFKNGVATLRVKITGDDPVVLRAQNGALVGESESLKPDSGQAFADVSAKNLHYEAIRFLKEQGVVSGYPDGTFQPAKTVNRVEALKMLMLAFAVEAGPSGSLPFGDTQNSAWYAQALATALAKNIVKGYPDGSFRPTQTVNRAEYLKILFNSAGLKFEGKIITRPYEDVAMTDWFAPFAYLANQKNILDAANHLLKPSDGMTRADVAETIYRMKMIQQNGLVSYLKR